MVTNVNNYKQYSLLEKNYKAIYPNSDSNQTNSVVVLIVNEFQVYKSINR